MIDKQFKTNLRAFCKRFDVKAAEIVAGTGLSESVVYEMYNPSSMTTVSLDHAVTVARFLRERTDSLVNIQYLLGDRNYDTFRQMLRRIDKHLQDRQGALKYYEQNLDRMITDERQISEYLSVLIKMADPLDS